VVISIGQSNHVSRSGSAAYLVQALGTMNPIYAKDLWSGLSGKDGETPLGISDGRGGIRILGSAGVMAPGLSDEEGDEFRKNYKIFAATLPFEGRAGGNSLFAASATTELANRHMPLRLDINRACPSLIERISGSTSGTNEVINARKNDSMRNHGQGNEVQYPGKGFMTIDEIISITNYSGSATRFIDLT